MSFCISIYKIIMKITSRNRHLIELKNNKQAIKAHFLSYISLFLFQSSLQSFKYRSMKWSKKSESYQQQQYNQKIGCSFLRSSNEKPQFFLAKKIASPQRSQESIYGPKIREMRSPKNRNGKISLKLNKQKSTSKINSQVGSLASSIQPQVAFLSPLKPIKQSQYFIQVINSQSINYRCVNNFRCQSMPISNQRQYQHYSQTSIKQLKFEGSISTPVIKFANSVSSVSHTQHEQTVKKADPKMKASITFQSTSLKEQIRSQKAQTIVKPSQSEKKSELLSMQDRNLKSATISNINLPPQLTIFEDQCKLLDADKIIQKTNFNLRFPQTITQSVNFETPIRKTAQKNMINELTKSFNTGRFGSPQYFKEQDKFRPVQKMQDVAEIMSLCESNASIDGDDESIVLGRLDQFDPFPNLSKPQVTKYQKAYSGCDSIVIFQ